MFNNEIKITDIKFDNTHERFTLNIEELANSIRAVGVLTPILINSDKKLMAGRRRIAAVKLLGRKTVPAIMFKGDSLKEGLASIDVSLQHEPLDPLAYEAALLERKIIWEQLYPNSRQHVSGGSSDSKESFVANAATKLKVSRSKIEKAIVRAEKSTPLIKKMRADGKFGKSQVDYIATLKPETQNEVAELLVGRNISDVRAIVGRLKGVNSLDAKEALENFKDLTYSSSLLAAVKSFNRVIEKHIDAVTSGNATQDKDLLLQVRTAKKNISSLIALYKPVKLRKAETAQQPQIAH